MHPAGVERGWKMGGWVGRIVQSPATLDRMTVLHSQESVKPKEPRHVHSRHTSRTVLQLRLLDFLSYTSAGTSIHAVHEPVMVCVAGLQDRVSARICKSKHFCSPDFCELLQCFLAAIPVPTG